jgi:hypothetical protein
MLSKIRYTGHISCTRSNNPQVAYAVYALNNCHEYDPVDEIMGLAKSFTERSQNECLRKFPYAFTQMYC